MAASTLNWVIIAAPRGFAIMAQRSNRATREKIGAITTDGKTWCVKFTDRAELDFSWASNSADIAVGYVRGIERCVTLNAGDWSSFS